MGMYDYFRISINMLPDTSDYEKELILDDKSDLQTKDFERLLNKYEVRDDRQLYVERYDVEMIPPEQRPYPPDHPWHNIIGVIESKNYRWETDNFTGTCRFYTSVTAPHKVDYWFEYEAEFTEGKLINIKRVYDSV